MCLVYQNVDHFMYIWDTLYFFVKLQGIWDTLYFVVKLQCIWDTLYCLDNLQFISDTLYCVDNLQNIGTPCIVWQYSVYLEHPYLCLVYLGHPVLTLSNLISPVNAVCIWQVVRCLLLISLSFLANFSIQSGQTSLIPSTTNLIPPPHPGVVSYFRYRLIQSGFNHILGDDSEPIEMATEQ